MTKISDGWFDLKLGLDGYMTSLAVPWMRRHGEEIIELKETFGYFFFGEHTFIAPQTAQKENLPALTHIMNRSLAVKNIFEERGQSDNPKLRFMPFPRLQSSINSSTLEFDLGGMIITRTIRPHPVHPIPEVIHKVTNFGDRPVSVNYYWCVGLSTHRYGVLSEKGDLASALLPLLGFQSSLYLIRMARSIKASNPDLNWCYLNLNWGTLQPGESRAFRTKLWCIQHPWIGTQFSGIAYALSNQDPTFSIAAMAATMGRQADAVCSILDRFYSPIFILSEPSMPQSARDALKNSPVRILMTDIQLDHDTLGFCAANEIHVIPLRDYDSDPFVATQSAIDDVLGYDEKPLSFVNILPNKPERQILLSYYFSIRRETLASVGHVTAPARNTFVLAGTVEHNNFEWLPHHIYARILGTKQEIPESIEAHVPHVVDYERHEYAAPDEEFNSLLTYFAFHDYTLPRMALENYLDRDNETISEFSRDVEKDIGQPLFWNAPLELIVRHCKCELYGPPFSLLISVESADAQSTFNAILGAQYAKAILACLHPVRGANRQSLEAINKNLSAILKAVGTAVLAAENINTIRECINVISAEIQSRLFPYSQIILQMGQYSTSIRAYFGRMCIYLFVDDYSFPWEVISSPDTIQRFRSVGSSMPSGRMSFANPIDTSIFVTKNVMNYVDAGSSGEVLVASNPTGDLQASTLEESQILYLLAASGSKVKLLLGSKETLILEDGRLVNLPRALGPGHPYRITGVPSDLVSQDFKDLDLVDKVKALEQLSLLSLEVDPAPAECTITNFIQYVTTCTGLHFIGHGTINKNRPALVLSDGNLYFEDFPIMTGSPWIFLNACEIGYFGQESSNQTAKILLRKGARYVIAPFLSIRDFEALNYSEMYHGLHLLMPLALIFHHERHDPYLTHGAKSVDHLAYVIYGDPFSPEGGELWELHQALTYEHIRDLEWLKRTKETLILCRRLERLWDVAIAELSNSDRIPNEEITKRLLLFCASKQEANRGMYYRIVAETLSTGQSRLENLRLAGKAYSFAFENAVDSFNRKLFTGYAYHLLGLYLLEAATLQYLHFAINVRVLQTQFRQAVNVLEKATKEFESIGTPGDAKECLKLSDLAKRVILRGEKTDIYPELQSLFHEPRPLV